MASIALIGPDGAGKTTVARMIESSIDLPVCYLYMGVNTDASNVALPTTRLSRLLKRRLSSPRRAPRDRPRGRSSTRRGTILGTLRATVRFANLLADEWYRQSVSWWYQLRGYIVLCDRYYLFDYNRHLQVEGHERKLFRLHRYLLEKFYPHPTLVIFLDAPAPVLFARKREGTIESLETRRRSFLMLGRELPNFIRVDATRPLAEVCEEIRDHIRRVSGPSPNGARLSEERP